ncbi:MAG: hypothetical protein A2W61_02910 [Deltaproteobacteria bacterium RIFCSPLOWO2_01_44_7]|nr:MAG: hypothetical protein A2712_07485 [Deltaproteobacteria bacterium RIFCSPHIGHO2_01_FULL_43_49]OGQ14814.1 MAG: hypothetical protein A3D22_09510 [Deltaproteobacteria bacterium RIFCSPHIGHO2_02_FULL_44_53]OGQ28200.1 MAG: hypothetical protein A3D98_08220 [Deltaproteobacteria bacterium RIFCSPHIGHO2_12_FULL_44_21]OGQ31412.1 MAG: hypothetical protein A2979_08270 [Deltaproteobacteria bacterium RIFCSPLOWO2_01_FULL_45_74]OGQ38412.1 MAG: hypothetical protein A2W61_02910 [Deltaproteobacteria bacterium 
MKSVSVKRLREELPAILKDVEEGEEYLIIYRSKPVGEIIPLKKRRSGRRMPSFYDLLDEPFGEIRLPEGKSSLDLIRDDRR